MKEFNFNSQVCTDRFQSERLLALGLKKETADMVWTHAYYSTWAATAKENPLYSHEADEEGDIPAWSLHRLVSTLINNGIIITFIDNIVIIERYKAFQKSYELWDDVYDNIIDAIEWLIKEGYFNKEYLV